MLELAASQARSARPVLDRCYQDGSGLALAGAHWLRHGGRRVWHGETRIHIAVREVPPKDSVRLARRLQSRLESIDGVRWARFHAPLGHAVVELDASAGGMPDRDRLTDLLVGQVGAVEAGLGLSGRPFVTRAHPEHHPGDPIPILLAVLEGGIDLASSVASFGMRRLRLPARPLNLELLAVIDSIADIPDIRKGVERSLSIVVTDVWLEVAAAALRPLVRGDLSGAAGFLHRYLRVHELLARRAAWSRWEPRLFGTPDAVAGARLAPAGARPVPLPDGPLERNAARLALGAFSAFTGMWFTSGRLEPATAAIFAGLPRPARLGRDAFASRLGYRLARADVLVLDPQVLRRLDRLDCVAVDAALCESAPLDFGRLAATIDHAGLQLVWVGPGRLPAAARRHGRRLVAGPGRAVRRLQEEGRGVVYIGSVAAGLAVADCGLCLVPAGWAPASTAHILAPGGIEQAIVLVDAVAGAHRASRESIRLSSVKIALAVALASTGLNPATTQRILGVAGLASMLAMVNGIRVANGVSVADPAALAPPEHPWYRMGTGEVLAALGSGVDGISEAEARRRSVPPPRQRSAAGAFARLVGEELDSPLTPVLGAGAALSFLTGARTDAAMITSVILFNALYGGAQRFRTEALIRRLSRRERQQVLVRRAGSRAPVVETALVPGDVIELSAGEAVPDDCRILAATALEVDEASLTGESMPVAKTAAPCDAAEIAGRRSMLYAGTHLASGNATVVVTAVGASTESGRAARLAAGAGVSTGVEERLRSLTAYTAPVAAAAGILVALTGRLRGQPAHETLATGVSLSVAAVPEGLPILAGLAQSSVAGRLSARGTLVRDPRALEALGRMNVLCADKTGTLTEGRLALREVSDGREACALDQVTPRHWRVITVALRASPSTSNGAPTPHPTDRALIAGAREAGITSHDVRSRWVRLDELPFEPGRAYQAALAELDGGVIISVKGAPEVLLPRCTHHAAGSGRRRLTAAERKRLLEHVRSLAHRGYRVLAVAERRASPSNASGRPVSR
ncbi:MAG TPA: HAD-IC family P-type ATPase [Gammaproteobacteria bacterium]|nr:HAD-IC family P-type ATPase [Gammaproteobacteria bacterium]